MAKDPRMSWSEHHRVPAELAVLFDFLNTLDERSFGHYVPQDELPDPDALLAWLVDHGLAPAGTDVTAKHLREARRLRDVLRRCAQANRTGALDDPTGLRLALPLRVVVAADGSLGLGASAVGVPGALGELLANAAWASAEGSWKRVKMCAAEDCRTIFYDHSKPRNGRWCETLECGNRVKVRSYRRRRKPARS